MDCYDYCGHSNQTYIKVYVGIDASDPTSAENTLCGDVIYDNWTTGYGVVACPRETLAQ